MKVKEAIDEYELKARVWPALIAVFPAVLIYFTIAGIKDSIKNAEGIILSFGCIYLISVLSRYFGKLKERKLIKVWGGLPTTNILKNSNTILDNISKQRYRYIIQYMMNDKNIHANRTNIDLKDEVYESMILWLKEQTRDKNKYELIYRANIAYGFCRNLLGIKIIGIIVSLISLLYNSINMIEYNRTSIKMYIVEIVITAILIVWLFIVNNKFVYIAAEDYAKKLLSACENMHDK